MAGLEEKRYWIALNMITTPRRFRLLLEHFPSPKEAWEAPLGELQAIPGLERVAGEIAARRRALDLERDLAGIERLGLNIITLA
ncbi:MAG: DNA-protecting protein DprA, partial [Candidatus Bipolaricaulia bacterium]